VVAMVDPVRIEQVLTNLLDNAIKFSDETSPIGVVLEQSLHALTLTVSDRGIGVPLGQRERIFERFHQVPSHPLRGGMGLGLYISRQIVELHGGTIAAEFPDSGGTRMRVSLPLSR
jgi:signal transduction histidine kinase